LQEKFPTFAILKTALKTNPVHYFAWSCWIAVRTLKCAIRRRRDKFNKRYIRE
jgi:hypothetical protein